MAQRRLGTQGLEVSELGLGCMGMSDFYTASDTAGGGRDEKESIATIHRAIDLGITFLDTADMYGPFRNEELVGRAIAGRREKVIVATKFGNVRGEDGSFLGINGSPEYVRMACEASLRRLKSGGNPAGRGELPRNSKWSSRSRRSPVMIPARERSPYSMVTTRLMRISTGCQTPGSTSGYR